MPIVKFCTFGDSEFYGFLTDKNIHRVHTIVDSKYLRLLETYVLN